MSRPTDEELGCLAEIADDQGSGACAMNGVVLGRLVAELRERRALDEHRRKSDEELIERRKADLTAQDLEALSWVRDVIRRINSGETRHVTALAVLDKLLAREVGR